MKFLITLLATIPLLSMSATETRTEVIKATSPHDDAKENRPDVPDVYSMSGKFERIVILRFKYQADLLEGIEREVKAQKIQNAVILSGVGSVRGYHFHVVSNRTFPSKNIYVRDPEGSADISGMNGFIMAGRVHCHITFATPDRAFGGHLEQGTAVFTFAAVTIGVLGDKPDLSKLDDKTYR